MLWLTALYLVHDMFFSYDSRLNPNCSVSQMEMDIRSVLLPTMVLQREKYFVSFVRLICRIRIKFSFRRANVGKMSNKVSFR